jgi:hypothetical protein
VAALALCSALLVATPGHAQDAPALTARHGAMRLALANNPFGRPLVLESSEPAGGLRGDIYARIDQPFSVVGPALLGSANWCEILMLHLNIKQCRTGLSPAGPTLGLLVGDKRDQLLSQDQAIEFVYQRTTLRPDYLQLRLNADQGPMGTSHYRIVLEVVALEAGQSFLHLSYAYDHGLAARLAMEAYLATLGREKVGFSVIGQRSDGQPRYIGQLRGVVERNTMRYYLAIEAFLEALALPQAERFERRLAHWHAGVERYPLQLHELTLDEYLTLKRRQALPG